MVDRIYSDKEIVSILKWGAKLGELSWTEIAIEVNKECNSDRTVTAIRKKYSDLIENQKLNGVSEPKELTSNVQKSFDEQKGTGDVSGRIVQNANEPRNIEYILKKYGVDLEVWEPVTYTIGEWEVAIANEEQNRVCATVRVKLNKIKQKEISTKELLEVIKETFEREVKPLQVKIPERKKLNKDVLINMNVLEAHIGKLVWSGDTNYANYDSKIAVECIKKIIRDIVIIQDYVKADRIVLPVGGDFLNGEGMDGSTTMGTIQMNDGRYKKLYRTALDVWEIIIATFKEHFNYLDLLVVEGNHDRTTSFYLYEHLKRLYANDKQCNFEESLTPTQVYHWGDNVLFFHHNDGGKTKNKRKLGTYAQRYPQEWGNAKNRIAFENHEHHFELTAKDENGITKYILPAICPVDDWHNGEHYVGADPSQAIFVIDKNDGVMLQKNIYFDDIFMKHTDRQRTVTLRK